MSSEKSWLKLKPILEKAVKVLQITMFSLVIAAAGILMGEQSLNQKQKLEEKKSALQRDNLNLGAEIKALERRVTLLRSDPKTIEKAAKRKLGMTRPDETIYIFGKNSGINEHP
ncbi:MAG: septum formation initiator family protein [Desulfomonile tiedjei]|uniref:Septum formation initiator family protein n=1 Tax=Desulfomonile tiedjei TaxID=2358 RepID=A0A9D6Z2K5_9BACT|nr:septum formation initiator family protein [Desulfomonile tiedjei]